MSRSLLISCGLFLLFIFGCGSQAPTSASYNYVSTKAAPQRENAGKQEANWRTEFINADAPNAGQEAAKKAGENAVPQIGADLPAERKIIFTGQLQLEVKDFAEARKQLDETVHKAKAYYSKTEIAGDSGTKRSGTFTIKVPVEQFQLLVNELTTLGNPVKNQTDSQDVTEEFVDTQARVKNLKAEEEVLNRLLKEAGGRLEDIFKIREQILKNRQEIERNEARVIALGKMVALSTLTVSIREIETFVASVIPKPSVPIEPEFSDRAEKTWSESFGLLKTVSQKTALLGVAIAPWLPVLASIAVGIWLIRRYTVKRTITA